MNQNQNPYLFDRALQPDDNIKWHKFSESENSSQALCISAFGTLRDATLNSIREHIVGSLVGLAFSDMEKAPKRKRWDVGIEVEDPQLMNEYGSQPTSVDALLTSSEEVVAVESKFQSDARDGFGTCSQPRNGLCNGFYGPGSINGGKSSAWCRLETWDGKRTPRLYWAIGRQYFQPSTFLMQSSGDTCPLRHGSYQLMRNFLFAASYAKREQKSKFGVLVICSKRRSKKLIEQVHQFRSEVLLPEFRENINLCYYEDLITILEKSENSTAKDLATYLEMRIQTVLKIEQ